MTIETARLPLHPLLGRYVRHDSESRRYAYPTAGLTLVSAVHARRIPVLDQGQVGSCTGNAGIGCLGTDPFYPVPVPGKYSLDEAGALQLYSDAETIDGDGPYPPQDNGSTGLSVAQALKNAGEISGYQHTFTPDDALLALGQTPVLVGIPWFQDMFSPDADGRVHPTGALAGGHEIVADEIDAANEQVWFTNSWGEAWGVQRGGRGGRFYLSFADFGTLLGQQGDVTILVPLTQPAPVPTPAPAPPGPSPTPAPDAADAAFAAELRAGDWLTDWHPGSETNHVRDAAVAWLAAKNL